MPSNPAHDIVWRLRNGRYDHRYEAADEIERLRTEVAVLAMQLSAAEIHANELQALIDAWAEARTLFNDGHDPWTEAEWDAYTAARDALLAAATKEDDNA